MPMLKEPLTRTDSSYEANLADMKAAAMLVVEHFAAKYGVPLEIRTFTTHRGNTSRAFAFDKKIDFASSHFANSNPHLRMHTAIHEACHVAATTFAGKRQNHNANFKRYEVEAHRLFGYEITYHFGGRGRYINKMTEIGTGRVLYQEAEQARGSTKRVGTTGYRKFGVHVYRTEVRDSAGKPILQSMHTYETRGDAHYGRRWLQAYWIDARLKLHNSLNATAQAVTA